MDRSDQEQVEETDQEKVEETDQEMVEETRRLNGSEPGLMILEGVFNRNFQFSFQASSG